MKKDKLVETFLANGNLSLEGKIIGRDQIEETLTLIERDCLSKIKSPSTVYLKDRDPLRFSLSFFSLLDAGHLPIPLANDFNRHQLETINRDNNFRVISDGAIEQAGSFGQAYPGSYASLTSGTTSTPKLCYLSIEKAMANAKAHADSLGINRDHTVIQSLPLYHSYGLVAYLWTKVVTGNHLDFNRVFLGLKALARRKLNKSVLHIGPAQLKFMLKEAEEKLSGIDVVSVGGGLCRSQDLLELVQKKLKGARGYVTYGLTEAGPRVTTGRVDGIKKEGFIGKALDGITLKVLDRKTRQPEDEGVGKLCIQSPSLKVNTDQRERIPTPDGNFLLTNDLVEIQDQVVHFISREDDLMKVGGISVYASDIEKAVKKIPAIDDCIVLPEKSELYGDRPILFVEGNCDLQVIRNHLKGRLSPQQVPRKIFILEKFPRHSLLKIDRQQLRNEAGL